MDRRGANRIVVVSGLPGSGKSTLARPLAAALNFALIDKDTILQRLFESKGTGDAAWRRIFSRESDAIFEAEARAAENAVLVSHWHLSGMREESGTPTGWLNAISDRIVNVHCVCEPEVAARRFLRRKRHPGHLDGEKSYDDVLAGLREIARMGSLEIGMRVEVDTSKEPDADAVVREVRAAFRRLSKR